MFPDARDDIDSRCMSEGRCLDACKESIFCPAKNLREFIAEVKAHKPAYQYASAGNGSLNHLLGEMLNKAAGLSLDHVPYKW